MTLGCRIIQWGQPWKCTYTKAILVSTRDALAKGKKKEKRKYPKAERPVSQILNVHYAQEETEGPNVAAGTTGTISKWTPGCQAKGSQKILHSDLHVKNTYI